MDLELLACFCDEASDLLAKWESICLRLEKTCSSSDFDELFRVAHNLKGSSRAVGLELFGNFVHKVEDGITVFKTGEVKITKDRIVLLLKAQSILSDWITNARSNPSYSPEFETFIAEFQSNLAGKSPAQPIVTQEAPNLAPATDSNASDTSEPKDVKNLSSKRQNQKPVSRVMRILTRLCVCLLENSIKF